MEVRGASEKLQGGMCSGTGRGWCRAARSYLAAASPLVEQAKCTRVNRALALCLKRSAAVAADGVHYRAGFGCMCERACAQTRERHMDALGSQVVLPVRL